MTVYNYFKSYRLTYLPTIPGIRVFSRIPGNYLPAAGISRAGH